VILQKKNAPNGREGEKRVGFVEKRRACSPSSKESEKKNELIITYLSGGGGKNGGNGIGRRDNRNDR